MIRFTMNEFDNAYDKSVLVCEKYPEITKQKADMICGEIYSTDTLKTQYNNVIKSIEEYLK